MNQGNKKMNQGNKILDQGNRKLYQGKKIEVILDYYRIAVRKRVADR